MNHPLWNGPSISAVAVQESLLCPAHLPNTVFSLRGSQFQLRWDLSDVAEKIWVQHDSHCTNYVWQLSKTIKNKKPNFLNQLHRGPFHTEGKLKES